MLLKILISRSVQTPISDKNWQTSCPLQTFVFNISRQLEFTIEQGHRVNWVSRSLDSRVTGSLGDGSQYVTQFHVWPIRRCYDLDVDVVAGAAGASLVRRRQGEQHVLGLEVTVDDVVTAQKHQAARDAVCRSPCGRQREPAVAAPLQSLVQVHLHSHSQVSQTGGSLLVQVHLHTTHRCHRPAVAAPLQSLVQVHLHSHSQVSETGGSLLVQVHLHSHSHVSETGLLVRVHLHSHS